jgi:hypothetical protein
MRRAASAGVAVRMLVAIGGFCGQRGWYRLEMNANLTRRRRLIKPDFNTLRHYNYSNRHKGTAGNCCRHTYFHYK